MSTGSKSGYGRTGVTFGELIPAAEKEGIRLNMPLLPRKTKTIIGSLLEREPYLCLNTSGTFPTLWPAPGLSSAPAMNSGPVRQPDRGR
jgi:hypothetical protein